MSVGGEQVKRVDDTVESVQELGRDIGAYIREQRNHAQISLRQLSKLAGVSNPYLSQIERGLRKPSAGILQQIANGLRISAEALYVQAGMLDERAGGPIVDAVVADTSLSERQKQVLIDVYESFRRENLARQAEDTGTASSTVDGSRVDGIATTIEAPAAKE
jgi:transcriptional regulator with XRE-family HTH domain